MNGFFELHLGGKQSASSKVSVSIEFAIAAGLIDLIDRKILPSQLADRYCHPAFLFRMVMDPRNLAFSQQMAIISKRSSL